MCFGVLAESYHGQVSKINESRIEARDDIAFSADLCEVQGVVCAWSECSVAAKVN